MKTLTFLISLFIAAVLSTTVNAQTQNQNKTSQKVTKTESFKVFGNCSMCKDRIEDAAKSEGAEAASWDSKTKMLLVTYDPSRTSKDGLNRKIASAGHDTETHKAPDDVYSKLPGCCHYERAK